MSHANRSLHRAERSVNQNSSQEARNHLEVARNAYEDEDYFTARRMAIAARSAARTEAFMELEDEEVMEQVREDREDFREAADEIRENNQELAEELQEAETEEERREIIREYREERMDIIEDRREEMTDDMREDIGERRDRSERDAPNETSSRLRMELDGNELEVDGTFVGGTGGFTVDKSLQVENGEITGSFNFVLPNGPATQVLTEYESEMERTIEDGDYDVSLELRHNGNVRESISDSVTVPGEVEIERRTKGIEAAGNSVELDDENEEESGDQNQPDEDES
jgi:hypothetical protein